MGKLRRLTRVPDPKQHGDADELDESECCVFREETVPHPHRHIELERDKLASVMSSFR